MRLKIRQYRWSDLETVWALHRICLSQVGLAAGDGVYYEDDFPRIYEVYMVQGGDFLVGEVDSRVVAMGGLRRVDDTTVEVCRLRVHPEFQRRGYATQVMEALEARARELRFRRIRGDTTLSQTGAIALYAKQGWRELSREQVGGLTVVYGEKELDPALTQ